MLGGDGWEISKMISHLEISLIKGYRFLSRPIYTTLEYFNVKSVGCRFTPSCSEYMEEAIKKYGVSKGTKKGLKRISRCNPRNPGGYDPLD